MTITAPIALTTGEPAGIGPDLAVMLAQQPRATPIICLGDHHLLTARARQLGLPLTLRDWAPGTPAANDAGVLSLVHVPLAAPCTAGTLDSRNAPPVLAMLDAACDGCGRGAFSAMVSAPVHKGVINDAGIAFSGHTEYFAERTGTARVVMMLVADQLRVALATTHLPLRAVPDAVSGVLLDEVLTILHAELRAKFGIKQPHILVCGLNPHAGEDGHLGREEIDTIMPALQRARARGMQVTGPLPADTLFTPRLLADSDAVLAMYHDQGLPVLKYAGFGHAVNVTLGLPVIRTSVDHGTALSLAGTGKAESGSLHAALALAGDLVMRSAAAQRPAQGAAT